MKNGIILFMNIIMCLASFTLDQIRSSRSQMFFKISVLKNCAIFLGKHLCWRLSLIKLQVLPFSIEHVRWLPPQNLSKSALILSGYLCTYKLSFQLRQKQNRIFLIKNKFSPLCVVTFVCQRFARQDISLKNKLVQKIFLKLINM